MGILPNQLSIAAPVGSQFNQTYQLLNDDGTLMNITNKIFEFVIRADPAQTSATTPLVRVTSTAATSSGTIFVTTGTSTLLVSVSSSAMGSLVAPNQYVYALWMDQGLPDATALVTGTVFASQIAQQF